jgi:hypothetical protein
MANTIQMKFSDTTGTAPTSELAEGELGINTADGLLWFGNDAATTAAAKFNISSFTNDSNFITTSSSDTLTNKTIGSSQLTGALPAIDGSNLTGITSSLATNVTVAAQNSADSTHYPTFVDGATGTQGIETDSGMTYNPSTGALTVSRLIASDIHNSSGEVIDLGDATAELQGLTIGAVDAAGHINLKNGEVGPGMMQIYEDAVGGTHHYMTFKGPQTLASSATVFQLPEDNGTTGYLLTTNGSGVTSWLNTGTLGPTLTPATGAVLATNAAVIPGVVPAGSQGDETKFLGSDMQYHAQNTLALGAGSAVLTFARDGLSDTTITFDGAANQGIDVSASGSTANFALDIDGMTDIGAALASGDLFAVDDGANGTNKKTTINRISTYVQADIVDSAPSTLDTLNELAAAIGDDANYAATITTALGLKATLASPTFTGTVAIPNVANLETAVVANTAKVTNTNLTHTGDVTGSTALTIATDAVDIAMLSATGTASSTTFLRGDNTWVTPTDTNTNTTYSAGTNMTLSGTTFSATDTDTVYTHPTSAGNKHIPTAGASGQFLKYSSSGTAVWAADNNTDTNTTYTGGTNLTLSGTQFNVDDAFLKNDASDTTSGTITAAGFTTTGTWTFDEYTSGTIGITTIQDSGTTFNDNDTSLMTAAAINDQIGSIAGGGESNQNAWTTITVPSGTTTQLADTTTDTLAFTAAGGMTITGGADDTIQFSSADTNTTYSAGTNMTLSGTTFSATDTDTVYTHPTTAGNKHVPTGGSSGQFLKYSSSGTAVWAADNNTDTNTTYSAGTNMTLSGTTFSATDTNTTYSVGDGGLTTNNFTDADHTKLNGIASSANNYSHTTNANLTGDVTSSGNATTIATDAVDIAMLSATGTASSSTYLRGDNTWAAVSSGSGDMTGVDLTGGTGISIGSETGTTSGDYSATITNSGVTSIVAGSNISIDVATGAVTITATDTDTNTTYSAGSNMSLSGTTFSATDTNTTYSAGTNMTLSGTTFAATDTDTVYTHPTSAGNKHVPTGGSSGQFLKYSSSGTAVWAADNNTDTNTTYSAGSNMSLSGTTFSATDTNTTYSAGTNMTLSGTTFSATDTNTTYSVGDGGLTTNDFTNADHTKLNGIASSANNYSHPTGAGNNHVPTGGSADQVLTYSSSGVAVWADAGGGGGGAAIGTGPADDRIAIWESGTGIGGQSNATISSGGNLAVGGTITDGTGQVMSSFGMDQGAAMHGLATSSFASGILLLAYAAGPSDERLKTEISNIEYGLDEIKALTPKWFKYNESTYNSSGLALPIPTDNEHKDAYYNEQRTGFMAADVKTVMPKLVSLMEDDKDYETYDKDALIFVLVNAIKELEARVATLEG